MSGFAASLIDRTLGGYTIRRVLARGGMGIVYEGVQESLQRRVAIKVMYPHLGDDESFRERFQREARAIAQLRHPNIVGVIDYGTDQGYQYMIMELIDGFSLRDELSRRFQQDRMFSSDETLAIVGDIATALSYAHRRGMIHRDVKPANVMLDADGDVFLTDFGLVKLADAQNMTMTGMIVGTPEYMAPEQSIGLSDVTPSVDQYSLAVVTYQLLVGRVPFTAPTPVGVMQKHISEPPPSPRMVVPTFPSDVELVLMRGLSKDPRDRYETIDAFLYELRRTVRLTGTDASGVVDKTYESVLPPTVETTIVDIGEPTEFTQDQRPGFNAIAPPPFVSPSSGEVADEVLATPVPERGAVSSPDSLSRGPESTSTLGVTLAPPLPAASGFGGRHPPALEWTTAGQPAGSSRGPLLAVAIVLALVLVVGVVAAAAFVFAGDRLSIGGADATSTPSAAARMPTADSTVEVAILDPTPTTVDVVATSTERLEATPTVAFESTATEPPTPTAQLIAAATPSPIVIVALPKTATPSSTSVVADWNLLVDEQFVDTTLFHLGLIDGGATTGLVDGWYGITVPDGRWQTVSATWIEPMDSGFSASYVGFLGNGKAGLSALFRTEPDGTFSFYACWLASNGAAGCDEVVKNFWTPIFRLPDGSIEVLEGNVLSLYIENSEITFSVNSAEVAFRLAINASYGHWGLFAQTEGRDLTAWFYYLQVYARDVAAQ